MTTIDVGIRARFINQLGPGARSARTDIESVERAGKHLNRASFAPRMVAQFRAVSDAARRLQQNIRQIDVQRLGMAAAGVAAAVATLKHTMAAPALADADFKDILIDIAQKAEVSKDRVGALSDEIKGMADRLRSSPLSIAKGIDVLMGSGLDLDISKRLVEPIQKVAKAYRVETDQVAKAVFSMVNNLKVAPDDIEVALGRIAQAAADGRYEVKDFAAGLPELAATMQKFNQTGLKGVSRISALVEVVAGQSGEPGQATAWSQQMLDKAMSPDVVRNFAKKGIKIDKRIRKAMKTGDDIMEVIYGAIMQATKGDATKLVDFFGDEQARDAAVALMQNIGKYRELRDKYEKIKSPDKLNSDLEMRKEGTGEKFRTFSERWLALMESIGQGVNVYVAPAVEWFGRLLDMVTRLSEAFPNLTGAVTLFGGAAVAFGAYKTIGGVVEGLSARMGLGGAGATGAGAAGAGEAVAGAGAGGAAVAASRAGFLARLMPWLGRAGLIGLGLAVVAKTLEKPEPKVVDRAEQEERLQGLREQLREFEARIASIETQSKLPELAQGLTLPLKLEKGRIEAEIRVIEETLKHISTIDPKPKTDDVAAAIRGIEDDLKRLGTMQAQPRIDPASIEKAISRLKALIDLLQATGTSTPSLMNNIPSPSPPPAQTGPSNGRRDYSSATPAPGSNTEVHHSQVHHSQVHHSTVVHQHIYGGDAARLARLAQREQERAIRSTRAGALHEGAFA